MRKVLMAVGVVLVAAALVGLAYMDAQLRYMLFGSPQTPSSFQSQPGGGFVTQTSGALIQQAGYMRVVSYLLGVGGLALIILGSTLPPRAKEKKEEIDSETPSQLPPWEESSP